MWVVQVLENFELEPSPNNVLRCPFPVTVDKGKMAGLLPVYETIEDAKYDYPDADYVEIKFKVEAHNE